MNGTLVRSIYKQSFKNLNEYYTITFLKRFLHLAKIKYVTSDITNQSVLRQADGDMRSLGTVTDTWNGNVTHSCQI